MTSQTTSCLPFNCLSSSVGCITDFYLVPDSVVRVRAPSGADALLGQLHSHLEQVGIVGSCEAPAEWFLLLVGKKWGPTLYHASTCAGIYNLLWASMVVGVMDIPLHLCLVRQTLSPLTYSTQKKTFTRRTNEQIRVFFLSGFLLQIQIFVNIQGLNYDPISYEFFNILKFFRACKIFCIISLDFFFVYKNFLWDLRHRVFRIAIFQIELVGKSHF